MTNREIRYLCIAVWFAALSAHATWVNYRQGKTVRRLVEALETMHLSKCPQRNAFEVM